MGRSAFVAMLVSIALVIPAVVWGAQGAQAQAGEGWTTAGGNPQCNGASVYNTTGVGNGTQWVFRTGDHGELRGQYVTMAGLYVGPDGTIFSQKWDRQGSGSNDGLVAINPDGTMRWFSPVTAGNFFAGNHLSIGQDGTIFCLVYSDGESSTVRTTGGDPIVAGYRIAALNPIDGTKRWEYVSPDGGIGLSTYPVASPNGRVVFFESSSEGYGITALNPDGSLAWRLPLYLWSPYVAIAPNSTIYAIPLNGRLCAFDPDGVEVLNVSASLENRMPPLPIMLDGEGNIYIVTNGAPTDRMDARIDKYSPRGELEWSYTIANCSVNDPPIVDGSGRVYVGFYNMTRADSGNGYLGTDQGILSLDRDGNPVWSLRKERGQMAVSNEGFVYIASANVFFALDPNGTILWERGGPSGHAPINSQGNNVAIGPGGALYFLGQLSSSNGLSYQGYIMSVRGTPSPDDPSLAQDLLSPILLVAVASVVFFLLYVGMRRNGSKGR